MPDATFVRRFALAVALSSTVAAGVLSRQTATVRAYEAQTRANLDSAGVTLNSARAARDEAREIGLRIGGLLYGLPGVQRVEVVE